MEEKHVYISHVSNDDLVDDLVDLLENNGYIVKKSDDARLKVEDDGTFKVENIAEDEIEEIRSIISWSDFYILFIEENHVYQQCINWEIEEANRYRKRIIGIYVGGATKSDIPKNLEKYSDAIIAWNLNIIIKAIDGDLNGTSAFQSVDGSPRPVESYIDRITCSKKH